jgi:hypothetical protein
MAFADRAKVGIGERRSQFGESARDVLDVDEQ